jgi:hypothetical protein
VKIIGAGLGRTGTTSLKAALERLGFDPCYHMTEVFAHPAHADFWVAAWHGEPVDWDGVLGDFEATVDWPACTFYEELMRQHPDAKVLLSVRDPERWYESDKGTHRRRARCAGALGRCGARSTPQARQRPRIIPRLTVEPGGRHERYLLASRGRPPPWPAPASRATC